MCAAEQLQHKLCASHCSREQSVFLFTVAGSLAAEENRVTVTHIRSVTPGKRKMKAR